MAEYEDKSPTAQAENTQVEERIDIFYPPAAEVSESTEETLDRRRTLEEDSFVGHQGNYS